MFLLVEDDEHDVLLMQEQLRAASPDISLYRVHDGVEAVRYLKGEREFGERTKYPIPDVIVLDLKMPRFSGFDFLQWLHRDSPHPNQIIPVVVLSSSAEPADIQRAYMLGANAYMVKPVPWEEFTERVLALADYWTKHARTPKVSSN